jgi:hypothetical protein
MPPFQALHRPLRNAQPDANRTTTTFDEIGTASARRMLC